MPHPLAARFEGALVGLAVLALGAIFFLVLLPGAGRGVKKLSHPVLLVRDYPTGRLMRELGEYEQKIDCASFGAQGLTGYVWVDQAHRRLVVICR